MGPRECEGWAGLGLSRCRFHKGRICVPFLVDFFFLIDFFFFFCYCHIVKALSS